MNIECKKSDNTQLFLYSPSTNKLQKDILFSNWFKAFPKFNFFLTPQLFDKNPFKDLKLFSQHIPISKNIIFTKGENIKQDNDKFFSSLNGIIKKSIHTGCDGYVDTGYRIVFLYILIYDGLMYQLTPAIDGDIDLKEIGYGQLQYVYQLKLLSEFFDGIGKYARDFGDKYLIEFIKPDYFNRYLDELEQSILDIDPKQFERWGTDFPDIDNLKE